MHHTLASGTAAGALVALMTCGASVAQGTPQYLLGGAGGAPTLQQQVWCQPAMPLCPLPMPAPPVAFAGGTAYNSWQQVIWDSNGLMLMGVTATAPPCVPVCGPIPMPALPAGAVVCGLAFNEPAQMLIAIDSSPAISGYFSPPIGCPTPAFTCSLFGVIPPNMQPGGLAYSEKNNLLYFSASFFGGGAPMTVIQVSRFGNPCVPLCPFQLPVCPNGPALGPVTGLAFDDANDDLYATDGTVVMRVRLNLAVSPCAVVAVSCCQQNVPAPYYGLELEASHPLMLGVSCTAVPCPACPAMTMATVSDPTVGNPLFAFTIANAPANQLGVIFLGFPGCTAGFPFACGTVYIPLGVVIDLPAIALPGVPPCGGAATVPLPLPNNYSLCGLSFCAQTAVVCAGLGIGLTNAINATITDD